MAMFLYRFVLCCFVTIVLFILATFSAHCNFVFSYFQYKWLLST